MTVTTDERPPDAPAGDPPAGGAPTTATPAGAAAEGKKVKIDPRLRARRIAVKREAGRRRLRWAFVAAAVVAVLALAFGVARSPLLSVHDVQVTGATYTDPAALAAIEDSLKGHPMLTLDTGGLARQLEALPWVRRADVWRSWPNTVRIDLAERRPVAAYYAPDGQYRVVDSSGKVIVAVPGQPVDLVVIAGEGPPLGPGEQAPSPVPDAALVASSLPPQLAKRATDLVPGPDGLILRLSDGPQVVLGTTDDLRDKLVAALTVLEKLPAGTTGSLDVRVPKSPTLTPGSR